MTAFQPFHVAIIPDGNRRWAKQRGLTGYKTIYDKGFESLLGITESAFDNGVTHLSLWGSSHANIADRSSDFFINIDKAFRTNVESFSDHPVIEKYDVRIDIVGEWRNSLTDKTVTVMEKAIASTAHRTGHVVTILIDYSGTRERAAAVRTLLSGPDAATSDIDSEQILRAHSWTGDLPDLDLIVRTGAWTDPHNSAGFMNLLADEAQYSFPQMLWPDFNGSHLGDIIHEFQSRERRMGK